MKKEILESGLEYFSDAEKFEIWIETKSIVLGNKSPSDLLKSEGGVQLVLDELNRLKHGHSV